MQEGAETRNSQSGIKVLPRVGTRDGADSQAEVIGDQMPMGRSHTQRQVCLLGRDHQWVTGLPKPPIQTVNPPKGVKYHNPIPIYNHHVVLLTKLRYENKFSLQCYKRCDKREYIFILLAYLKI